MNDIDKTKKLLEDMIRKRDEETVAFLKLLKAIEKQLKASDNKTPDDIDDKSNL